MEKRTRIHALDYLRGIAAVSIMIYHYLSWTSGKPEAEDFLGRVGIYGVSVFYILSGLTLYHVYFDALNSTNDLRLFYWKRALRIFPLLWLAQFLTIVLVSREVPAPTTLLLNISGLFSIFDWSNYIGVGAWSIGNELAFYLFLPLFIFLAKTHKPWFLAMAISLYTVSLYFSFSVLSTALTMSVQWNTYINPLNQISFFLSGFLIGYFFNRVNLSPYQFVILLALSLAVFIGYPAHGDIIHIVTGANKWVFTFSCVVLCFSFYKFSYDLPRWLDRPLRVLGHTSYSIYLLHPIVWSLSYFIVGFFHKYLSFKVDPISRIILSIFGTLVVSYISYTYFEKYFMKKATSQSIRQPVNL